jgi:hypothetical protein
MDQKIKDLANALALNELKEIYGEDAIYRNNYEEFRGLVLHEKVREPYTKMLNKYTLIINQTLDENGNKN